MPDPAPRNSPPSNPEDEKRQAPASDASAVDPTADSPTVADTDASSPATPQKPRIILCPYCGQAQQGGDKCSSCGGLFEPLSRRATQIAMGPWTVRNKNHPFRPGCSYEVLVGMIERGQIGPMTVLRGPTTRQFWSIARNVPGISHLLGYCHACGHQVAKDDKRCPSCDADFKPVKQRNELGLQFPNRRAAEAAQRSLNRLLGISPPEADTAPDTEPQSEDDASLSEDQAQVEAAAAAAAQAGEVSPESIFEHDAQNPGPTDDGQNDLISDLLGGANPPAPPTQSSPQQTTASTDQAPPVRAETPSPLPASDPQTPPNPAALPPRREINWLVIGLVGLNVLVAAAVIVYVATRGGEG